MATIPAPSYLELYVKEAYKDVSSLCSFDNPSQVLNSNLFFFFNCYLKLYDNELSVNKDVLRLCSPDNLNKFLNRILFIVIQSLPKVVHSFFL